MSYQKRNWVVDISTDIHDPAIFGPYTRQHAEKLVEQFNERIDSSQFGFVHATAHPIQAPRIGGILKEFGQ